jgi:conjugal transfer pilus assembly protein TraB
MINGVDAPTGGQAQQDPLPIAFQTVDPINMPNGYKLNIKGCRFLGYAWGSLSTERMMARIETGNCIINGQTVRVDLKGHVMGEDGKPGVRGRVVSKQGQALANAALASALEAIGNLYQNTAGTTTTSALGVTRTVSNEDIKNAAIGGGVAGGAEKLSDFYLQRANEMFPIIESDAGRIVEILVTKGVEVTGLENLGSNSIVRKPTTRKLKDE